MICYAQFNPAQVVHFTRSLQLGQQMHYLNFKILAEWDSYDYANFTSLLKKAGRLHKVFGIYDSGITQEEIDSVTSPPNRFYDSYALAEIALKEATETKNLDPKEVHILYTFKAI